MSDALVFNELTKAYDGKKVVDCLSFSVPAGKIFGIVGPNGSGKTTTIKMLCGLVLPTSGTALVNGLDVVAQPKEVRRTIGYVSQQFSLYRVLSVEQNIDFYSRLYGLSSAQARARKETVIEITGLQDYRGMEAGHLSGGSKQRLALACALVHEPSVLILDEPTVGIDPIAQRALWDLIATL